MRISDGSSDCALPIVGVVRYAGNLAARGPDDRVGDVAGVGAAVSEHAHRQDLGVVGDAGHARCVVGQLGAGGAGNVRAAPRAVVGRGLLLGAFARHGIIRGPVPQVTHVRGRTSVVPGGSARVGVYRAQGKRVD